MATPPKPRTRKPGAPAAPVAAKAPVKAAPKPIAKPVVAKAKSAAAPEIETPAAKTAPLPAIEPVVTPEPIPAPVVETATEAAPEAPVAEAAPVAETPAPAPAFKPVVEPPTPLLAAPVDSFPPVAVPSKKGTMIMTDVMETAKTYAEEAKTRIQSAMSEMNDKTKAAMEKSAKAFEELGELTKGNLEAVVESSKIAAKGVESLGQEAAEFSRKSFEKTSATMKSFAAVKTPTEFFQLQGELMSAMMDGFASEASKSSEALLKLASDISQPISNRVSIVTEKMKSLAA